MVLSLGLVNLLLSGTKLRNNSEMTNKKRCFFSFSERKTTFWSSKSIRNKSSVCLMCFVNKIQDSPLLKLKGVAVRGSLFGILMDPKVCS